MLPQWSFSQTHITMSLQNCEFTSDTTLEFDVYLFNDGTTSIQLGALSFGINYDRAILNGGTPGKNAFTYLPGSKDNVFANLIRYVPQHALTNHHLRFTTSPVSKFNAPTLAPKTKYKFGRFILTNTTAFTEKRDPALKMQLDPKGGYTNCVLNVFLKNADTSITLNDAGIAPRGNMYATVDCHFDFK